MKKYLALFLLMFSYASFGKEIMCTQVQACNTIKEVLAEPDKYSFKPIEIGNIDPHHFSPTPKQIKELVRSETLIVAPMGLHPWAQNILKYRASKENLVLTLPQDAIKNYSNASTESLSHYWLYSDIHCGIKQQLAKDLIAKGYKVKKTVCDVKKDHGPLSKLAGNFTVILTHDALKPLLENLGIETISLKGSGHDEQVSTKTLKKLQKTLSKHQSVIWIFEHNIHVPAQLKKNIRKSDKVINIDIIGDLSRDGNAILEDIATQIRK